MTLWQIITSNSTLPVQPGVTFWDHLNNQSQGNSGVGGILPVFYDEISIQEFTPMELLVDSVVNEVIVEEGLITEIVIEEDQLNMQEY